MSDRREFKDMVHGVTPATRLVFPHLNKPNTKFNPDGTYGTAIDLSGDDATSFIKKINDAYETEYKWECENRHGGKALLRYAGRPFAPATDKDKVVIEGVTRFRFGRKAGGICSPKHPKTPNEPWKATIPLWSAKMKPVKAAIWGGTLAKVSYTIVPWFTNALGFGVRLQLEAVQILDLVTQGERSAEHFGFTEEDGYDPSAETNDAGTDVGTEEGESSVDF